MTALTESKRNTRRLVLASFFLIFGLVFIRYCYYGFTYYHQLDDYIQYHNYTANQGSPWKLIMDLGMLAARPLSGAADVLVWSHFFNAMLWAVAILSALYAAAGCLLKAVFSRHFRVSPVFLVLFALLPLGFEGTYWVSASSRVLCGLFFAALSAYFYQRLCETGRLRWLWGYFPAQLLCFGFYEQALVLSVALTVLLGILNWKRFGRRTLWGLLSFLGVACYFGLTSLAKDSALYSGRIELVLPNTPYYWKEFFPEVVRQVYSAFCKGGFYTLFKGIARGLQIMVQDGAFLYLLGVLLLCGGLFFLISRGKEEAEERVFGVWPALLVGLLLALAPLAPFFVLANPWFSMRGTVMSFAGIALLGDTLVCLLFSKASFRRMAIAWTASGVALFFCIAGVSELHDYRRTNENDQRIVQAILETVDGQPAELRIGVLNVDPTYLEDQNYFYHEHIHGVTESSWALNGALSCMGSGFAPSVTPLAASKPFYERWNAATNRLDTFDKLYFFDHQENRLLPVHLEQTGENAYNVFLEDGTLRAQVREEDGCGYLTLR